MGQLLTHIVRRSFGDDTISEIDPLQKRIAGECVNALFWRTMKGLEKNQHIFPLPEGLEPVPDTFGRFWTDLNMLTKAGREPLEAEVEDAKPPPIVVSTEPSPDSDEPDPWFMAVDLNDPNIDYTAFVDHGFTFPKKVSERRWQLWDGVVVTGKANANQAHTAGVRARIRELRAEHLAPAAGSVTST